MIEAEEHHSLLSTNTALIIKLLEACTAAKRTTVQEPLQHTTKDPPPELHVGAVNNINCVLQKFWTLETAGTEPQTENSKHADQKFLNTYSQNYITH